MIQELFDYIDARIKEVDSTIERDDRDMFDNNDEETARVNKFYKAVVGESIIQSDGNGFAYITPLKIKISEEVGRCYSDGFASVYDKAAQILECIINPKNVYQLSDYSEVEPITISPTEEKTNDSIVSCTLELKLRCEKSFF